jgi:hypothetical protein
MLKPYLFEAPEWTHGFQRREPVAVVRGISDVAVRADERYVLSGPRPKLDHVAKCLGEFSGGLRNCRAGVVSRQEDEAAENSGPANLNFIDSESAGVLSRLRREMGVRLVGLHLFV